MLLTSASTPRYAQCEQPILVALSRRICAIRVRTDQAGRERLGDLVSIGPDCEALVCGPGYNERTVRILSSGEPMYAFEDLIPLP